MLHTSATPLAPPDFLSGCGRIFACFDRQDSGNLSFGVECDGQAYFVKTTGDPASGFPTPETHAGRAARLRNAERLARSVSHPALTRFVRSVESPWGPMLVYEWAPGEHLYSPRHLRSHPASTGQRFLRRPFAERLAVVRELVDLHVALAAEGWVTGDFYDGCLIYDFETRRVRAFDLDHYHPGPYQNDMGRMFGSTRFMAPEEFEKGRVIDERTTVFALGRTMSLFLGDRAAPVAADACAPDPGDRHPTVAALAADFARHCGSAAATVAP